MPPRSLLQAFLALWITAGVVLFVASLTTARDAMFSSTHANPHLVLLGAVEALGAILFLVPGTMRVGAATLLAAIATGFGVHATLGEFRGDLLLYGMVVLFVAVHRPLTRQQLRAAFAVRRVDGHS